MYVGGHPDNLVNENDWAHTQLLPEVSEFVTLIKCTILINARNISQVQEESTMAHASRIHSTIPAKVIMYIYVQLAPTHVDICKRLI